MGLGFGDLGLGFRELGKWETQKPEKSCPYPVVFVASTTMTTPPPPSSSLHPLSFSHSPPGLLLQRALSRPPRAHTSTRASNSARALTRTTNTGCPSLSPSPSLLRASACWCLPACGRPIPPPPSLAGASRRGAMPVAGRRRPPHESLRRVCAGPLFLQHSAGFFRQFSDASHAPCAPTFLLQVNPYLCFLPPPP